VPEDQPPDWAWRLTLVRDERPNDALPTALRQPFLPPDAELTPQNPLPAYRALAARHATTAMTHFDHLRTIVFNAHIGLVRIDADDDGFVLVHTLFSQDAPDSPSGAPNTSHRIRLAPSTAEAPALKARDG
jgi:CHASE2 domain-containing sensor protein